MPADLVQKEKMNITLVLTKRLNEDIWLSCTTAP
jgi:hypothetical protein